MAYMDNAYRLILGILKNRMIPIAVIEAQTGAHASQIEGAIARQPDKNISDSLRAKIFSELNKVLPISVEDAFLNADKLCQKFPDTFRAIATLASDGASANYQPDITMLAADDFISYSSHLSLASKVEINALDDKKTAIEAAKEKALYLRLNAGNKIDNLISGASVSNLSFNQKGTFLWVSCYAKAMNISMKAAFIDIFNYMGANISTLTQEVAFTEGLAKRHQVKDFNNLIIATFG